MLIPALPSPAYGVTNVTANRPARNDNWFQGVYLYDLLRTAQRSADPFETTGQRTHEGVAKDAHA